MSRKQLWLVQSLVIVVAFMAGMVTHGYIYLHLHECALVAYIEDTVGEEEAVETSNEIEPYEDEGAEDFDQSESDEPQYILANFNPELEAQKKTVHPYHDKQFNRSFSPRRNIVEIRRDYFGVGSSKKVEVSYHPGGERIDHMSLRKTVAAVLQRMPNLKTTEAMIKLCIETMETESGCGSEKAETGIKKWKNYGIAQFRIDTAEDTISWLKEVRPDVHKQVMHFYDERKDMAWNLTYNVPFSIAMMAQYYWRVVPDLYAYIGTKEKRAQIWKAKYNTYKGLGTVDCYIKRNNQ